MTVRIKVWSDYVCPFCLPAKQPLAEATAGHDVAVEWMPFELRPEPTPTLRPEGDHLRDIWSRAVYPVVTDPVRTLCGRLTISRSRSSSSGSRFPRIAPLQCGRPSVPAWPYGMSWSVTM
ncbi:DsbA family protein [Streptosporangium canum]|uniref:DsbA family oxidoreductase n=1 Tax=Streptosporangium canum TaxID=324952 RepID=UPI003434AB8F